MLNVTQKNIFDILAALPANATVLDVGSASAPFKRATHAIDIVSYDQINWSVLKGPGTGTGIVPKENYVQHDICNHVPWPYADKQFDYSVCSHVLEDIRDPLWVCHELIRVSKAGYIEIPSRYYETTFNLEAMGLSGNTHHRWVIDVKDKKIRFTFKYMHIHHRSVNKSKVKYNKSNQENYLKIEWNDSFEYAENWLNSGKEIFEFYLDKPLTEKETFAMFRKVSPRNFVYRWLAYFKKIYKK